MKKILSAFAIASLFAVAGCPKKTDEKKQEAPAATKPTDDKTETPSAPATPDDKTAKPAEPAPTAAAGDFPAECNDYKDAMAKAAACDKLGAQRDTFKKQFDESWKTWEKLDAAGKTALAQGCKTTAQAVKDAIAKACP